MGKGNVSYLQFVLISEANIWLMYLTRTGDALYELKNSLTDPNSVLQSWDNTLVNPCTWFHVTCSTEKNLVTRV